MLNKEAYAKGYELGKAARSGIQPKLRTLEVPLPQGISQNTSQATAFRLGYRDGWRKATTFIKR